MTNAPVLAYFDLNKYSIVSVDAKQYGLGGVLVQNEPLIAYGSKSFTETQQAYSQTETNFLLCLTIVKKFYYYVYGTKFTVETDNKLLLGIL